MIVFLTDANLTAYRTRCPPPFTHIFNAPLMIASCICHDTETISNYPFLCIMLVSCWYLILDFV
ncbi:hypothetical protein HMPREF0201_00847 [Cedecea davisae DSM 4568]|uniref:Uncharacterized protein n=1 Tax=Cedecea davisae DSM 4568 TaxID=566551 RepID=S3K1P0_9ENTR|nr:hypothetical protein HMPREF0201_00847 [Cedecea davisae DSM 4568]